MKKSFFKRKIIACYDIKGRPDRCITCPAYQYDCGHRCWMVTGTRCEGGNFSSMKEKLAHCENCAVYKMKHRRKEFRVVPASNSKESNVVPSI